MLIYKKCFYSICKGLDIGSLNFIFFNFKSHISQFFMKFTNYSLFVLFKLLNYSLFFSLLFFSFFLAPYSLFVNPIQTLALAVKLLRYNLKLHHTKSYIYKTNTVTNQSNYEIFNKVFFFKSMYIVSSKHLQRSTFVHTFGKKKSKYFSDTFHMQGSTQFPGKSPVTPLHTPSYHPSSFFFKTQTTEFSLKESSSGLSASQS